MRGDVLKTKAFSSQSLGSKGSDTRAILSRIMVALKFAKIIIAGSQCCAALQHLRDRALPSGVV